MGKFTKGRLALVAALGVALGLAPAACGHPGHTTFGSIDLTVTVPAEVKVQQLTYEVSGNGIMPLDGRFQTSHPQQQFEKLITHVPSGDDYQLVVSAKAIDGRFMCKGATKVSVRKNSITRVHLALACVNAGDGTVVITVGIACTNVRLASYTVSPLAASVGGTIALTATVLDADAGALIFAWTAPSGSFADPSAAQTTYRCETAGHIMLNLLVAADICQESQTIEVDCLGPSGAVPVDARAD